MRFLEYLTEMPIMNLDSGHQIDPKTIIKMKKKYKTFDDFINAIKTKVKNLSDNDIRKLKAVYG